MHSPDGFPVPLIRIRETNSTNLYLNHLCNETVQAEFTTVISRYQTAGRGQRGNSWESEDGKNLLFSFVLYPGFLEAKRQFLLSQIISLAIKETLDVYTNDISIKWPNDIYWKDKKICGMLIEHNLAGSYIERSIAGIGININQQQFFSPAPNPVSLWQITGKEENPVEIASDIMQRVQEYYRLLRQDAVEQIGVRYQKSLFRRNGLHSYKDAEGEFKAAILRVEPEGRLILKDESGKERGYMFKEIEFRFTD